MRHLTSLKEQSKEELIEILNLAKKLKEERKTGRLSEPLKNRTLLMLFQKSSTRTRVSFEAAMTELGGHAIYIDQRTTQFGLADFEDEVRALMRFGHALVFRALRAADVLKASSYDQIPVVDACSEKYHPAQVLGDMLTMIEYAGGLKKIKKVVWLGIENNVSNTLKLLCAKLGIDICIVAPEADPASVDEELNKQAKATGKVQKTLDLEEALNGADFVHTDTWMNMEFFDTAASTLSEGLRLSSAERLERVLGSRIKSEFREEYERRKKVFGPYQLNAALIDKYAPKAKIMHCMPCHVGYEITRDAIDHPNSIIFDQAENRMHVQKGILSWLLDGGQ